MNQSSPHYFLHAAARHHTYHALWLHTMGISEVWHSRVPALALANAQDPISVNNSDPMGWLDALLSSVKTESEGGICLILCDMPVALLSQSYAAFLSGLCHALTVSQPAETHVWLANDGFFAVKDTQVYPLAEHEAPLSTAKLAADIWQESALAALRAHLAQYRHCRVVLFSDALAPNGVASSAPNYLLAQALSQCAQDPHAKAQLWQAIKRSWEPA